jgi:hypothetical protein
MNVPIFRVDKLRAYLNSPLNDGSLVGWGVDIVYTHVLNHGAARDGDGRDSGHEKAAPPQRAYALFHSLPVRAAAAVFFSLPASCARAGPEAQKLSGGAPPTSLILRSKPGNKTNLNTHKPSSQATNPLTREKKGGKREISLLASSERRRVQWLSYKKRYAIDDPNKGAN